MKRTLMEKNDDIAVLNARMEEAERAKEGLLTRINHVRLPPPRVALALRCVLGCRGAGRSVACRRLMVGLHCGMS
eukprot:2927431-Rhodomonas_salina.1